MTSTLQRWFAPLRRLVVLGVAVVLAFNLAACSGISTSDATNAARTAVNVAKTAADLTGNEQLKSVLTPVVNLLNATKKEVVADNIPAATSGMATFKGLWDTAAPVVKLAAGDNYGVIDKGVKLVLNTFGGNTAPTKDNALTALTGLIGPLTALLS
ncbi:MAG: hypothetical protein VKN83_02910 [Cyanobacteriota bacterium]|jgi:hypothetical protein|nr:hypothetical protein [Cyanobacteriota bacterium]